MGSLSVSSDNRSLIYIANAHGLTIPSGHGLMAAYVDDSTGNITPADASSLDSQKHFFVTEVIDANTLRLVHTGFLTIPSHGYTSGKYYYVTDTGDGSFDLTQGTNNDVAFVVIDANIILLIDNRATS